MRRVTSIQLPKQTADYQKEALPIGPLKRRAIRETMRNLHTQDNRITANPVFYVEGLDRIGPVLQDYTECPVAFFEKEDGWAVYHENKEWEALYAIYEKGDPLPDNMEAFYYKERWMHVQTCFTLKGCNDYLALNGHNVRSKYFDVRTYVDCLNRNDEMVAIRDALMSGELMLKPEPKEEHEHPDT